MFHFDSLAITSASAYALLVLITCLAAPSSDLRNRSQQRSLLLVALGTLCAYVAASPWIFLLGWSVSIVPFWMDRHAYGAGVRMVQLASAVTLALGFAAESQPMLAFALLVSAALLRKGVFPVHFWVPSAFEQGSLPFLGLLLNGHLGAYLLIRHVVRAYPEIASQSLPLLGLLAIFTSLYCALVAIVARRPRRILALLCTSQAAFILAGLENRNLEGVTGALLHWWAVALATTGMLTVYRALEVRTSEAASPAGMLGLGFHAPRLAVFLAVCALALVGLPGTLGFVAEDLLFHGSLESHPLLGVGLPLATALNAITALRLLTSLFMGRRGIHVPVIPDATWRERLALTMPAVLLVAGGIFPSLVIALRAPSAQWITGLLVSR